MRCHIKKRGFCHLTYYCFVFWISWLTLASVLKAENLNIPSPVTEIENIGESLDNERTRQKELRKKANDLREEIVSISDKVRKLKESIEIKEERIGSIKADLKKLETSYYMGGQASLPRDEILQSSITALLLVAQRANRLSLPPTYRYQESLFRFAVLAALIERL